MVIREMSRGECLRILAGVKLARLACAHENQPYVVPVYLAFDEVSGCLYGFTTPGLKVEWMRANPLVCVEVDEIVDSDQWVSIIANGRYEELPEIPGREDSRLRIPESPRQVDDAITALSAESRPGQDDDEWCDDERERAWQLLKRRHALWWEPGCTAWAARAHRDSSEPMTLLYYKIHVDQVTGHEATRDVRTVASDAVPTPPAGGVGWLRSALMRLFGGESKDTPDAGGRT